MFRWPGCLAALMMISLAGCDLERSRESDVAPEPTWEEPAPAPEPERTPEPVPEPAPEPEPQRPASGIRPAMLNGQWIGGPPSAFDVLLDIEGTLVTATDLTGERPVESTLFELVDVDGLHARFRAAGAGAIVQVHALFLTLDEALVWLIEESTFAVLRRVGQLPPALAGDWQAVETSEPDAVRRVTIASDRLQIDGEVVADLYPLASSADTLDVVSVAGDATGDVQVLHFRRLDRDLFLAWADGGGQFAIYYRTGARPDWLPGDDPAEAQPPAPSVRTLSRRPTTEPARREPAEPEATGDSDPVVRELDALAGAAIAYWRNRQAADGVGSFPASTEWSPPSEDCPLEASGADYFSHITWVMLGFAPEGALTHQYRFISEAQESFEVQARIDTDCDGVYHKLSIAGFALGGEIGRDPLVEDNAGE